MKYISTRGQAKALNFSEVALEGLARDGGLFIPDQLPDFGKRLKELQGLKYQDLAFEIFTPFVDGCLSPERLKALIQASYQVFNHPEVTPLTPAGKHHLLELYHGPTLAFKDVALQFLGNLFEELLAQGGRELNILGATSGDTGSAAIHGVKGRKSIRIFMLHPAGRVSKIQEKQMTTVLDDNVVNIAFQGTFDDGQAMVKQIFNHLEFKDQYQLGAVNSINWVRVMAQIVYYFYAAFRLQEKTGVSEVAFSVPTGNFGDIYAGYLAQRMGLPVKRLILATNQNDILRRVVSEGEYKVGQAKPSISPSMDIQVSSNFERFLFDVLDQDPQRVQEKMTQLSKKQAFALNPAEKAKAQAAFDAYSVSEAETKDCIRRYHQQGVLLDPHTAVGVAAAEKSGLAGVICLATAHAAKFGQAVADATGQEPDLPPAFQGILERESRCLQGPAQASWVEQVIVDKVAQDQQS